MSPVKADFYLFPVEEIVPISALRRNFWNEKYIQTSLNVEIYTDPQNLSTEEFRKKDILDKYA